MTQVQIRIAKENDARELLEIYTPYITNTSITFEYEVPTLDEFRNRIINISKDYPYLVCIIDEKIVGYAYTSRQKERAAYQWNVELSVYVDKLYLRFGIGKALYNALIEISKSQNIYNLYGCVTSPNPNSEKLHEYFGFKKLGVFHNTGYKHGKWHDVIWFEKSIINHESEPKPLLFITDVDEALINKILDECSYMIKDHTKSNILNL
ncbi:N-acetyltransferase [Romboutsia weinsteinii]|uniref:N-acetyltransferase n=1 Tax=Romboutsia weinsteinii TaxID=2020949 RepID=A0A371J3K8_9FIRM|nr:GNAT family N-acetyltransferase [Romboutsia weinsteinii]RDY27264.1 N-acetyltransferase [Romboutsia weinsteinii]